LKNNLEDMNKFAKMSATINEKIILESKELLITIGVFLYRFSWRSRSTNILHDKKWII
jgi:hypothetical protein